MHADYCPRPVNILMNVEVGMLHHEPYLNEYYVFPVALLLRIFGQEFAWVEYPLGVEGGLYPPH